MENDKIRAWLGLPAGNWPPDHYALLGLSPGEVDAARIEQHVHDRLAKLRCYQLSHPEQATEAMNRLAQAFMCLTDPKAKQAYDRTVCATGTKPHAVKPDQPTPLPRSLENGARKTANGGGFTGSVTPPAPVAQTAPEPIPLSPVGSPRIFRSIRRSNRGVGAIRSSPHAKPRP